MAAFDRAILQQLYDVAEGDESFVRDVLATYVEQARDQVKAMHVAIVSGDQRAATRAAHSLAGASLNVGAFSVATVCRRIEACHRLDPTELWNVEAELNRVCDEPLVRQ